MTKRQPPPVTTPSLKVTAEVAARLKNIRALWLAVYNDPEHTLAEVAVEFYDKIGELLEGKGLEQLTYYTIDKQRVLQHAQEF